MSDRWKADLELLAHLYDSWRELADEMRADVEWQWLRQVYKGRVIVDDRRGDKEGVHYRQMPSEEVKEAIVQHRKDLQNAHRVGGKTAFRARQMIQRVREEDLTDDQLAAMQSRLQKMQDDLIWAE